MTNSTASARRRRHDPAGGRTTKYEARFTRTDAIASAIRAEMRAGFAEIRTDVAQLRVTTTRWAIGVMLSMAAVWVSAAGVLLHRG